MVRSIRDTESDIPQFAQFALDGADFSPINPAVDLEPNPKGPGMDILSGSHRQKVGYSAALGMIVAVTELVAVAQDARGVKSDEHRLFVEYDDGEATEGTDYCLDSRIFVLNDDDTSDATELKDKVIKALSAVAEDRL